MFNGKNKKIILIFSLLILVFFVLPSGIFGGANIGASSARAAVDGNWIAGFLAWVTLGIASLFGMLLTFVTDAVNFLFTWKDFDANGAVTQGWVIVRDMCNMAFILVLLLIAFATILNLENYSMKKYLPKLLLMAVLINFSKTICFLLIDFSQIVMLTFANAFAGAGSNFVTMLQIEKLLDLSTGATWGDFSWGLFYAVGMALVFMLISFFVMVMLAGMLVMRIVMFWVLIVLSPIAFLGTAIPGGGKYWSQWWGEFSKYLIAGPVLAFFTWLSLTVAKGASLGIADKLSKGNGVVGGDAASWIGGVGSKEVQTFIIAIGLLIGTMKITKSFGAMGAGVGAAWADKAKNKGISLSKKFGKDSAKWSGRQALLGASGVSYVANFRNRDENGNVRRGVLGQLATNWRKDLVDSNQSGKKKKRLELLKKMGMSSDETFDSVKKVADSTGGRVFKGTAGIAGALTGNPALIAAGVALSTNLIGGLLKTFADSRKKGRDDDKGVVENERKARQTELERGKDFERHLIDLLQRFNPGQRNAESERIRNSELADLRISRTKEEAQIQGDRSLTDERRVEKLEEVISRYSDQEAVARQRHEDVLGRNIDAAPRINRTTADDLRKEQDRLYSIEKHTNDLAHESRKQDIDDRINFFDRRMEKYQPNRVTVEAAKEGSKEIKAAVDLTEALQGGADVADFSGKFYSGSGITSAQKRLFSELSSGAERSAQAIESMVRKFTDIAAKGERATAKELSAVMSIKQGLAAFKKSGKNIDAFEPIITVVNTIPNHQDATHKDRDKTVSDFESSVIAN